MKIGIVCYPTHGGSGVVASELGIALAKKGHEIHIVSYATPFRLRSFHPNIFIHDIEVASYPLFKYPPYALAVAAKLVELVEHYHLELIHSHYAVPHAASAYLAKQILDSRSVKTITTLHGTDIILVGADRSFHRVIQFAIEESDGVTAVSNYLKRVTKEEFDIQRDIRVIYNFVDTAGVEQKSDICTRKDFASEGEKIIMHASNFRAVKRVGDVVRVFAKIRENIPAKLVLIGEGPERLFVQQLTKKLKLTEDVHFLGAQDDTGPLFLCADLFVLTSELESFGLTALEAMACGVPVIATETGGLPEVITQGETGYLLPIGDIQKMAERAIHLLSNTEQHNLFRRQARIRARQHFNADRIIPQYEAFYREILNKS